MASISWALGLVLLPARLPVQRQPAQIRSCSASPSRTSWRCQRPALLRLQALDVLRIYGFNLILLPVNLAGTYQLARAGRSRAPRASSAARRRSVTGTTAGVLYVLLPYAIVAGSAYILVHDYHRHRWVELRPSPRSMRCSAPTRSSPSSACATRSSTSGRTRPTGCVPPPAPTRPGRRAAPRRRRSRPRRWAIGGGSCTSAASTRLARSRGCRCRADRRGAGHRRRRTFRAQSSTTPSADLALTWTRIAHRASDAGRDGARGARVRGALSIIPTRVLSRGSAAIATETVGRRRSARRARRDRAARRARPTGRAAVRAADGSGAVGSSASGAYPNAVARARRRLRCPFRLVDAVRRY